MYQGPSFTHIPPWEDGAPRFTFRTDNGSHQGGSHVHLYARSRGGYVLTNVCFTRSADAVIAYEHCEGKSTVSLDALSESAIRHLRSEGLTTILSKDRDWTQAIDPTKVIGRFPLSAR